MDKKRYRLTLCYDGTHYSGWQIQPNSVSIQQLIEQALQTVLKENIRLIASGRTDAGVHALEQESHFNTAKDFDKYKLLNSLNGILPSDIRIKEIQSVDDNFHARFSAKSKIYHYYLHLDPISDPFKALYRWHLKQKIDLDKMRQGAQYLMGTHNFISFSNESHKGACKNNPIKTIYRLDIHKTDYGAVLEFEGDGFLYKMVRNLTGTLVDVGLGKIQPHDVLTILNAKDRKKCSFAAPAIGLFLIKVLY